LKAVPFIALCLGLLFSITTVAQQKSGKVQRCATMNRLQLYQNNLAATRIQSEGRTRTNDSGADQGAFRLQNEVTIPVVVHIVLPNPYLVSDADVQAQIDQLNQDFSGLNADSSNASGFYTVRGHSRIRFCLARRTPSGQLTNGIERRSSNTGSDVDQMQDPIKYTSKGGLNAWNTAEYLNIWVGRDMTGQGILGYADNIGPGAGTNDGVVLNIEAFGTSSCYTKAPYNRGRTATHEVGHYFGLYHIWGDDSGGCTGDDFDQLPASTTFALPTGLYNPSGQGNGSTDIGDTPNQGDASGNCLSGVQTDGCSAIAPGKMYQNHMDYTYDACLTMFTKKQVSRMEWVLDNARSGLKNSLGCQPPANAPQLDVAPLASVSPGGFELTGCNSVYYPDTLGCPGTIIPKFSVVNNGLTTITTLTVGYSYDNGTAVTQTVSVNIPHGGFYVATFPAIPVTVGNHNFRFFTASPNGGTDAVSSNDSYTKSLTVMAPIAPPINEGFETTLQNWTIDNPGFDHTWERTSPGRNGTAGKLSIDNYNNDGAGNYDDFRSAAISVDPSDAFSLSFDLAHKNYPDPEFYDSLAVLVSTDCGQTFTRVYYKGGPTLATAGSSDAEYITPGINDWRTETITIGSNLLASGRIVIVFRNIGRFGNWTHIDNINLVKIGARDIQVKAINSPNPLLCTGQVAPSVAVDNVGSETITAFSLGYQVDNGTVVQQTFTQAIQPGATATVTLPVSNTGVGQHKFTVFSFNPVTASGAGDTYLLNDTMRLTFSVPGMITAPLMEDFTTAAFPPSNWSVLNRDVALTWDHSSVGNGNTGSAILNSFRYNGLGESDDLVSPTLNFGAVDSVKLSFDVAAAVFSVGNNVPMDTLEVMITRDCGNSFTTVYKKWGAQLQTVNAPLSTEFFPNSSSDWRKEVIDLSTFATQSPVMVFFRTTNNNENNIFLDNINFTTQVLPVKLKETGVLLFPNPFSSRFTVWHYQPPTNLRSIRVMNMAGQTVWLKQFTGNADKQEVVNLASGASGMYLVEIIYSDGRKVQTMKILKQ
jgi:hypothetical protein